MRYKNRHSETAENRDNGSAIYIPAAFGISLVIMVPLDAGGHIVELRYVQDGLTAGAIISGISLCTVEIVMLMSREKPQKQAA